MKEKRHVLERNATQRMRREVADVIILKLDTLGRPFRDQLGFAAEPESCCAASHRVAGRVDSIPARLKKDGFAARIEVST